MAYSELVKNFNRIRDYMREFYVYGFKNRDEYTGKSARSYDDERRRIESWLGDNMQFRRTAEGKNVFLSIDSRRVKHNPLFKAWKTKSFTDGDITLHFILFDILADPTVPLSLSEIMKKIDEYLQYFEHPKTFDESTVRKKCKEYVEEGLILTEKCGKVVYYRRAKDAPLPGKDVLDFFSEVAPCGVVGFFLLDKVVGSMATGKKATDSKFSVDSRRISGKTAESLFTFKHHYITSAMDSEIVCSLFQAIREKRYITIESMNRKKDSKVEKHVVPLQIRAGAQSGRQYLMAYVPEYRRITSFRTDNILSVTPGEICENYDELRDRFRSMQKHLWGVSTQSDSGERLEHVEFVVRYEKDEYHIRRRLEREKRIGTLEYLEDNRIKFSADVYDIGEMIPWIRTFLSRIESLSLSNKELEKRFYDDLNTMYEMYGMGGGDDNAVS